jgi:glycine cleavage system H protein
MNKQQSTKEDKYYTTDHEWVDFKGTVAYIGICRFKLTGFKQIQEISFNEPSGFKKQGEIIASIKYNDYLIEAHMPVDGKLLQVNEKLVAGNPNILLDCAESSAWLALIVPSLPHERKDLLLSKQYRMNGKGKYAK